MNMLVTETYVAGCPQCIVELTNLVASAAHETNASMRLVLSSGDSHAHREAEPKPAESAAPQPKAATAEPAPEAAQTALFDPPAEPPTTTQPNGFDALLT